MKFVLGVDPGKSGAFVLINKFEQIVNTWDMTYAGSTLSALATSEVYRDVSEFVEAYSAEHGIEAQLEIFIEKAFTKPTDAIQEDYIGALEAVCREVVLVDQNIGEGVVRASEALQPVLEKVDFARRLAAQGGGRGRVDGRVGVFNYAKSAGVLECCASFGLSYTLVHPKTWCTVMHKGADHKAKAKDKSRQIIERRWPEYAKKGSPLWRPRGRKMDDGKMDAYLIACYGLTV